MKIIAPEFDDSCINKAQKLKAKSKSDTDVGLITAEELKYVAENWRDFSAVDSLFNLEVLNHTGRITKDVLEQRMEWAIK